MESVLTYPKLTGMGADMKDFQEESILLEIKRHRKIKFEYGDNTNGSLTWGVALNVMNC
jgi:hypothetical protein